MEGCTLLSVGSAQQLAGAHNNVKNKECIYCTLRTRFVVATTTSRSVLLWTLLGPVTVAGALGTPVQTIAIKRYTTESNRGFAFSLFYSCVLVPNLAPMSCMHWHPAAALCQSPDLIPTSSLSLQLFPLCMPACMHAISHSTLKFLPLNTG